MEREVLVQQTAESEAHVLERSAEVRQTGMHRSLDRMCGERVVRETRAETSSGSTEQQQHQWIGSRAENETMVGESDPVSVQAPAGCAHRTGSCFESNLGEETEKKVSACLTLPKRRLTYFRPNDGT